MMSQREPTAGLSCQQFHSFEFPLTSPGLTRAQSADSPTSSSTPASPGGVVLRRPSRDSASSSLTSSITSSRASTSSLSPLSTPSSSRPTSSTELPPTPHRVSWIEDGVWLPPPRSSPLLRPPSLEPDSLSISSVDEEPESPLPTASSHYPTAQRLADKVMHRFSAVGQALGGLVCHKKRLTNRVQELSERRGEPFADAVRSFLENTLRKKSEPWGLTALLQEVRSQLTSLRETLLDCGDIQATLDELNDLEIGEIAAISRFYEGKYLLPKIPHIVNS